MDKILEMTDKTVEKIAKTAAQLFDGITTVANTKGISRQELEAVYKIGLTYYNTGKTEEAEKIFLFLTLMSHTTAKYWTALGAVRQVKKQYAEAIKAYAAAAMMDVHRPKPHYHAAECALMLGDLDSAESGCKSVLALAPASADPANGEYCAKADKLLKVIKGLREKASAEAK